MEFYPKLALDIKGRFVIPSYQRGYRWGKQEVTRLLDDIYECAGTGQNYCLQPIVVKKIEEDRYELIDGQQRLTTIYLILKAIQKNMAVEVPYSMEYETRRDSAGYLDTLDPEHKNEYIDFRYIYDAYRHIDDWFGQDVNTAFMRRMDIFTLLMKQVQVLWYEADAGEDSHELFSRMNIGKIPLTNAELVKALFLNRGAANGTEGNPLQSQIAAQWDNLERELHDESLWAFLTNADAEKYDTRLDLLFDFFTSDRTDRKDKYAIFFELSRLLKEKYSGSSSELWRDIYEYFLQLREWFGDNGLYHRAGYLSTVNGDFPISRILNETRDMGYDDKIDWLDGKIADEVSLGGDDAETEGRLRELSYLKDRTKIENILLLMNVRTTANSGDMSRFPFNRYKSKKGGWSLEHVHAQHSEGLIRREQWVEWLTENARGLEAVSGEKPEVRQLLGVIYDYLDKNDDGIPGARLTQIIFNDLREKTTQFLTDERMSDEDLHSISNLALLGFKDNIVLSNSLFETKRQKIIDMDSCGVYVPVCTRNVFMKYYTPAGANQPHYWSGEDRGAYLDRILSIVYNINKV